MSTHTRLTVAGSSRRAEVVVASGEPLGTALPRLLELLGETSATVSRPVTLVSADGEQVDIARSPQQLTLTDGTLLRLVRIDAAPPPPVVIDITDAAADAHDSRPDLWDDRARAVAGGTGIALATAIAGLLSPLGDATSAATVLLGAVVVLLAVAIGFGMPGLIRISACMTAAAAGLVVPLALASSSAIASAGRGDSGLLAAAVAVAAGSTAVLLGLGVARRRPGAAVGGAIGAVLGTVLLVLLLVGVPAVAAAAITGTVAAFATGPLPWIALAAAGLTDLDQRVGGGERVTRTKAFASVEDAYAALTWSVVAVSAALAVTGVALVLADELWAGLLSLAFALVAATRSRAYPLRAQVWSSWAVVAAIAASALVSQLTGPLAWLGGLVALVAAVLVAAAVLVRPRPHVRARLRGLGNVVETLAVVALLPLLLGALGVYAELIGMFGGGS